MSVATTRRIASVRIHIERVIGLLEITTKSCRAFYLQDYLITAENGLCTIDKMAVVCCALPNLCGYVVPIE